MFGNRLESHRNTVTPFSLAVLFAGDRFSEVAYHGYGLITHLKIKSWNGVTVLRFEVNGLVHKVKTRNAKRTIHHSSVTRDVTNAPYRARTW